MGVIDTTRSLLLFGSSTGTTRLLAASVRKGLASCGIQVVTRNVRDAQPRAMESFPLLVLGCSTWEDGAPQRDFRHFLERLGDLRLDGRLFAVFGPGSRSYQHFCQAVDLIEHEMLERGARLLGPSLRIDGSGYSTRPLACAWGHEVGLHALEPGFPAN